MGYIFADITLDNPRRADLAPVPARALADTGALNLCIPQHLANQLQLETESIREVSMADGRMINVPYVGPIRVAFGKRTCFVGALVFGDEVLLGAVPMEDMDLIVDPLRQRVTVDPASPNIPHARAKPAVGQALLAAVGAIAHAPPSAAPRLARTHEDEPMPNTARLPASSVPAAAKSSNALSVTRMM